MRGSFVLTLVVLSACIPVEVPQVHCGPQNCAGCCSATDVCETGVNSIACGSSGLQCVACSGGTTCSFGLCVQVGSGGGAAATGGGSAGGGTATGGGVATGGSGATGGGEATGGGSVATGGGSVATGGGSVATGGGSVATGGGSVATGGGSVATGGGTATGGGSVATGGGSATGGGAALPGDTCATATQLVTSTTGTTVGYTNDFQPTSTTCTGVKGPDRMYKIDVGPGQRATVTVTPSGAWDPSINLIKAADTCNTATPCVGSSDFGLTSDVDLATWWNQTGSTQSILAVVDSYYAATDTHAAGNYSISVLLDVPPLGDRCENPEALTAGVAVTKSFATIADDYRQYNGCFRAGQEMIFSLVVNAGDTLVLTATPSATTDVALMLVQAVSSCGANVACFRSTNAQTVGGIETLTYTNSTGAAQSFLVGVESRSATPDSVTVKAVSGPCGPATCPVGCCSATGCVAGTSDTACGSGGLACSNCTTGSMFCDTQVCR